MSARLLAARHSLSLFRALRRGGLLTVPDQGPRARRLGHRPPDAAYGELRRETHRPNHRPRPPSLHPGDAAARRYLALMHDWSAGLDRPWTCGVFDVPEVKVHMPFGVHHAAAGLFPEVHCGPEALENPKYELTRRLLPLLPAERVRGAAVFLSPPWHHNYHHWLIDILPRLSLLGPALLEIAPVALPSGARRFARESLALAVGAERIREISARVARFDRLIMPTALAATLDVQPRQTAWLREVLLPRCEVAAEAAAQAAAGGGRRIYISRSDAAIRRVANEAEVLDALAPFGFEVHRLAGLSVPAQMALFAGADLVVSHHGAALANLAFCRPGAAVLEIFQDGHFAPCFMRLAQAQGLRHGFMVGAPSGGDTVVDVAGLRRVTRGLIARAGAVAEPL